MDASSFGLTSGFGTAAPAIHKAFTPGGYDSAPVKHRPKDNAQQDVLRNFSVRRSDVAGFGVKDAFDTRAVPTAAAHNDLPPGPWNRTAKRDRIMERAINFFRTSYMRRGGRVPEFQYFFCEDNYRRLEKALCTVTGERKIGPESLWGAMTSIWDGFEPHSDPTDETRGDFSDRAIANNVMRLNDRIVEVLAPLILASRQMSRGYLAGRDGLTGRGLELPDTPLPCTARHEHWETYPSFERFYPQ